MENKFLNDAGQIEFKLNRYNYDIFVRLIKDLTGLSIDKVFFDSDEDFFVVAIEVKNTDLPF